MLGLGLGYGDNDEDSIYSGSTTRAGGGIMKTYTAGKSKCGVVCCLKDSRITSEIYHISYHFVMKRI